MDWKWPTLLWTGSAMGQSSSSSSSSSSRPSGLPARKVQSPRRSSRPRHHSPDSPASHSSSPLPHRSLRTKKKSLELPDLASLGLSAAPSPSSPTATSPYSARRHSATPHSAPIPIPIQTPVLQNPYASPGRGRTRGTPFDSTQQITDVLVEPSTHIPLYDPSRRNSSRRNPFIRGAPLQYNSTRSFTTRDRPHSQRMNEQQQHRSPSPAAAAFVPETVHSTIPIALHKAEAELARAEFGDEDDEDEPPTVHDLALQKEIAADEPLVPVPTKIYWKAGGRTVLLARAGDDNWKGRLAMELDRPPSTKVWSTTIPLLPGTHHIKFVVDGIWRVADFLPTAVDDEGSLSNYIHVHPSGITPPHSSPPPKQLHHHLQHLPPGHSFWSTSSSTGDAEVSSSPILTKSGSRAKAIMPKWTSEFPPELIAAAGEEEAYLASSSSAEDSQSTLGVAAPNIPPAPVLPRHLDKLILNTKKDEVRSGGRSAMREKEREERRNERKARSSLGMTSTTASATITTSSTDVANPPPAMKKSLDFTGVADDTSVLPVPSHVVLHHLCTSAIRNGVLAVGNTTRYRKKYMTTIYYKPT